MRALVIDDSKAIRLILGRIVKQIGFDVLEAENGLKALEQLKKAKGTVDLALVDWNMPEMNGYEFVCAVREDPQYKDLLLMMVTTETEMSQVVKALEAGANEYLMKTVHQRNDFGKINHNGTPCRMIKSILQLQWCGNPSQVKFQPAQSLFSGREQPLSRKRFQKLKDSHGQFLD